MICKYCNMENPDGSNFCQFCGAPQKEPAIPELTLDPTPAPEPVPVPELTLEPPAPADDFAPQPEAPLTPVYEMPEPAAPMYVPVAPEVAYDTYDGPYPEVPADTQVLKWGIIALCFAITFPVNFLGLPFALKARRLSNTFLAWNSGHTVRERLGRIFGTVALPVSIVLTLFFALYILILILAFAL